MKRRSAVLCIWILSLLYAMPSLWALDLKSQSAITGNLLMKGNFKDAEPLIRECLKEVPEDLYFLAQLDMSLNGQGKYDEAEKVRETILKIWNDKGKQEWVKKGKPVNESTWARMIVFTKSYRLIGTEYYEPEVIGNPPLTITNFYKILVQSLDGGKNRLFKLEMSKMTEEYYVVSEILENGYRQFVPYGNKKPDLKTILKDMAAKLDGGQ